MSQYKKLRWQAKQHFQLLDEDQQASMSFRKNNYEKQKVVK